MTSTLKQLINIIKNQVTYLQCLGVTTAFLHRTTQRCPRTVYWARATIVHGIVMRTLGTSTTTDWQGSAIGGLRCRRMTLLHPFWERGACRSRMKSFLWTEVKMAGTQLTSPPENRRCKTERRRRTNGAARGRRHLGCGRPGERWITAASVAKECLQLGEYVGRGRDPIPSIYKSTVSC